MRTSISKSTLRLAEFSLLLALEAVVCFTPLGSLPAIGMMVATLGMIPVIITAVVMGTGAGALMGFFTGLFSFIVWTFMPPNPVLAFVFTPVYSIGASKGNFWSLVICFVPRILVGVVAGASLKLFTKLHMKNVLAYSLCGILGSMMNTLLVIGGIYLFFGSSYAAALGQNLGALPAILGLMILTNGLPEALLGGVCAYAIGYPIRKHLAHNFE
jgi:uncharacterized membrane protein